MHFLLFGSVWFWLVIGIAVILMMTATEKGSGLGATVTFLVSVAILYFFGNQYHLAVNGFPQIQTVFHESLVLPLFVICH